MLLSSLYGTDSSLLHSEQNLKQLKHMCKILNLKFTHRTLYTYNSVSIENISNFI